MAGAQSAKVMGLTRLLAWREEMRVAGRTVVHCHGCFDIVHPGHIAHLQEARSRGDVLLVTVSSDAHVNKGHARPLIPDDLRAGSLAALECVDAVYINPHATAVELLGDVKPDIFVKGKEYERSADPRFQVERETVVAHGGRVVFTSGEIVYSSTALINSLTQTDPFEQEKLDRLRERYDLSSARLAQGVRSFEGKRVVVIGDYIQDRYHFCDATAIASEGPMMTLRLLGRKDYDGGAAVVARHAAALGANAVLVTALGGDMESAQVRARLQAQGVEVRGLSNRRQLVTKHRYLCETTKVLKVDEGMEVPVDSAAVDQLEREVTEVVAGADVVILTDFGYGLLTTSALEQILPIVRKNARYVTADVSGRRGSLLKFKDVDLLTPTERELRETLGDFGSSLPAVTWQLMHSTGAKGVLVTLGRQGALGFDRPAGAERDSRLRSEHVPAMVKQALDPLGCGDALLTVSSLSLAAGLGVHGAMVLGSLAAGIQAGRLGNEAIGAEELMERVEALGEVGTARLRRAS